MLKWPLAQWHIAGAATKCVVSVLCCHTLQQPIVGNANLPYSVRMTSLKGERYDYIDRDCAGAGDVSKRRAAASWR